MIRFILRIGWRGWALTAIGSYLLWTSEDMQHLLHSVQQQIGLWDTHALVIIWGMLICLVGLVAVWGHLPHRKPHTPRPKAAPISIPSAELSPADFEREVGWVFCNLYQLRAVICAGSGDGGIDVKLLDNDSHLVGIIQAKRYAPDKALSPAYLRDLYGVKCATGVSRAWLVTTARFSNEVRLQAHHLGIELVDGQRFESLRLLARSKRQA